jgi:hypothetical protein
MRRTSILIAALAGAALVAVGFGILEWRDMSPRGDVPLLFGSDPQVRFLAVGRQGYGNQWAAEVAGAMGRVAARERVHFVVLTGDNFYPAGVRNVHDIQWQDKFERLYDDPSLRELPFFAVLGNHDHRGNAKAQLEYAALRRGSGRWRMPGSHYYQDFGQADGRVLLRIVFLDTVPMARSRWKRSIGRRFLVAAMGRAGDPVWRVVVGHAGVRSPSQHAATRSLLLRDFEPLMRELQVDLVLSGNDRFQHVLDDAVGPLHVSTNGGGAKLEMGLDEAATDNVWVSVRPGFSSVTVDRESLKIEMVDRQGAVTYARSRPR